MKSNILILRSEDFDLDDSFVKILSKNRRDNIKRYKFDIDKKLSAYGELILRMMISKELDYNYKNIVLSKHEGGKPYMVNAPDIFYNISHTRNAIICAISCRGEIGVDVERIDKFPIERLASIYHTEELKFLRESKEDAKAYLVLCQEKVQVKRERISYYY